MVSAMKTSAISCTIVVAALASAGCLNADLKTSQVCASALSAQVPAMPATLTSLQLPPQDLDLSNSLPNLSQKGISGTVLMQQLTLSATGVDLSGIQSVSATVEASGSGSTLAPVNLSCNYQKPSSSTGPLSSIVVPCNDGNLFDYLQAQQSLTLVVTLDGVLPDVTWTPDVGACFSVDILVDYTKL
jgi:hypothetical protein